MSLLHTDSLAATVDACNEALLFDRVRCKATRRRAAKWIASRVGQPGGYCGLPAITEVDSAGDYVLFTGEKITTSAGRRHILGEEACRVIRLLAVNDPRINDAEIAETAKAAERELLHKHLDAHIKRKGQVAGTFCCGTCSVALWRNLVAGGMNRQRNRLIAGLAALKHYRDGKGRWRRYPYWYTMSALIEMPGRIAIDELRYAAPSCKRLLRATPKNDRFNKRRRVIAERVVRGINGASHLRV